MKGQKLLVTMEDIPRYSVLKDVMDKKLKGSEAAHILGLSCVHLSRLKKRLLHEGFDGLLRKSPLSAPNKKISEKDVKQILTLRKKLYYDFNIMHFYGQTPQSHKIPSSQNALSLANRKVDVCLLEDNRLFVLYKNTILLESKLKTTNRIIKKKSEIERLLNQREYIAATENTT